MWSVASTQVSYPEPTAVCQSAGWPKHSSKLTEDVEMCRLELNKCAIESDPVTSSPTGFGTPYGYSPAAAAAPAYGTCFLFVFPAYNFLPPSLLS